MKAAPKITSASITFVGGKPLAVFELQCDPREGVDFAKHFGLDDARLQPIADVAKQLDKEDLNVTPDSGPRADDPPSGGRPAADPTE